MGAPQKKCKCANKATCPHRWYDRVQKKGRRVWIPLGTNQKTAANRIADKKRGERALTTAGIPVERGVEVRLLAHLIDQYLAHAQDDHPATAKTKDAPTLASLLRIVGNIDIRTVTKAHIETWQGKRRLVVSRGRRLSKSTVNRELVIVRACFTWAETVKEWIDRSPVRKVTPFATEPKKRKVLLQPFQFQVVRDMPAPYNLINLTTLYFLPRLREVCALQRDDLSPVYAEACYIEVRRKGGRIERIQIDAEHMAKLRAELKTPEQQYLFPHKHRRLTVNRPRAWTEPYLCPANVSSFNTRYFRARGMEGIGNHVLRHTGTTMHMTELHTDTSTLQVMGGWTSRRMLDEYGHATEKSLRTAAEAGRAHIEKILAIADAAGPAVAPAKKEKRSGPQTGPRRVVRSA